jgi:hypothetical protein
MPYLVYLHGLAIEATTAEAALELAELYAARQAEHQNSGRRRGARQRADNETLQPLTVAGDVKSKPLPPLLARLQPNQLEALKAIAAGGKDGLTDEELCTALGIQRSSLGGLLSAISKHARALDIKFEGELIAKDPITTAAGKRGFRYIRLHGLNTLLRALKNPA